MHKFIKQCGKTCDRHSEPGQPCNCKCHHTGDLFGQNFGEIRGRMCSSYFDTAESNPGLRLNSDEHIRLTMELFGKRQNEKDLDELKKQFKKN